MARELKVLDFEASQFEDELVAYVLGMDPPDIDPMIRRFAVNEFADGSVCDKLYSRVYEARLRLEKRLSVQDSKDIEIITDAMETIMEHVARKMYRYGTMNLENGGMGEFLLDWPPSRR